MNDYWTFGYTPIHSFLARMSYEHPLATSARAEDHRARATGQ